MKLIAEISIWDNGKIKKASILNAYAVNLVLNESATFYYALYSQTKDGLQGDMLASGNLSMTGEDYDNWISDDYVWEFLAKSLNLVIKGDYVVPVVEAVVETPIVATVAETTTVEEVTAEEEITETPE